MKGSQKFLSLLLAVTMVLSMLPTQVSATTSSGDSTPIISVESTTASPGSTVDVDVTIQNNPGVLGATIKFTYGSDLTLVDATAGDAFSALTITKPGVYVSPCNFTWDGQDIDESDIKDGVILTLTFEVSESAKTGVTQAVEVSYTPGNIVDADLTAVTATTVSGGVTVINYTPGDVNGDDTVNTTDIILLRREITGGYDVSINEAAADVNADGNINTTDIILMRRYITGGYGVELIPSTEQHTHSMVATAYSAATCTEDGNIAYWYCTDCEEYYSNESGTSAISLEDTVLEATGHAIVIDEAVAATYTSTGLTEGTHCSVCGEVIIAQEIIPMLEATQYSIQYNIYDNDSYLMSVGVDNSNPLYYTSEDSLTLINLAVDGYTFEGWYDGAGSNAVQIKTIDKGTSGDIQLYAHWSVVEYKVQFDSPLSPMDAVTYTVDTGVTLSNAYLEGYTFMCWSDTYGNVVSKIDPGTTGHITLTANWTSKRNQTIPATSLGDPITYVDEELGVITMAYEIGRIENVPLYLIEDLGNKVDGIDVTKETTISGTITESSAETIAQAVASATTSTSAWTLSEEWNNTTSLSESYLNETSYTQEEATTLGTTSSGTWTIGSSDTGTETSVVTSGSSNETSSSSTVSAQITSTDSVSGTIAASVETSAPGIKVSGSLSTEISSSDSSTDGTEDTDTETDTEYSSLSDTDTKTWNTSEGYSSSQETSQETTTSQALTEKLSETVSYDVSNSLSETQSSTQSTADSVSDTREYASSLTYSTEVTESSTITYSNANAPAGYYRIVEAGILHVFAVVTYDIATQAFGVYTHNVFEDDTYAFIDYSKDTKSFDDYENGVLPFEVPYEVIEFVDSIAGASDGLVIDIDTGIIAGYTGTDKIVVIPEYIAVDNGDGTKSVVKVTGFEENVFKNNTDIVGVQLSDTITEIPDSAFEGCTSLIAIVADSVTKIGEDAFKNCTSLNTFTVQNIVTDLGENAFENVDKIIVNSKNTTVTVAATLSGAKNITITLSGSTNSLDDTTLEIPDTVEYFEFNGGGNTYSGMKIISSAQTTVINNITSTNNTGTVLLLSSDNITLNRVSVDTTGWAMILTEENTSVSLYGTVTLSSSGENAVICRDMQLSPLSSSVVGKLSVSGNILVHGAIDGISYLNVSSGEIIYIDEATYNTYKTRWESGSFDITLDANGGAVTTSTIAAVCDEAIGTLPTPTRTGYTFAGWYTATEDGLLVTETTTFSTTDDFTLYAQWIAEEYTVSWTTGTGYTISVKRTSSPNAGAATGTLSSNDTVYYGDILSVTYTAATGYSLGSTGSTDITVETDITSSSIYASASANSYTYSIVYQSTNGTSLGTSSATYVFGTTNTISAPSKSGYTTPSSQSVTWDSTSKTITFKYTPTSVSSTTKSGTIDTSPSLTYSATVQYQNRTASSVQVRVVWTTTLGAYSYTSYGQQFTASSGSVSTGTVVLNSYGNAWSSYTSSARTVSATSSWITVPLSTTNATTVSLDIYYYQVNSNGTDMSKNYGEGDVDATWSISIPAY